MNPRIGISNLENTHPKANFVAFFFVHTRPSAMGFLIRSTQLKYQFSGAFDQLRQSHKLQDREDLS
jgi:hypothetical protein